MEIFRQLRFIPLGIVAGFSTLSVAVGSLAACSTGNALSVPTASVSSSEQVLQQSNPVLPFLMLKPIVEHKKVLTVTRQARLRQSLQQSLPQQSVQPSVKKTAYIYWLKDAGNKSELTPSQIILKLKNKRRAFLEAQLKRLLAGPTNPADITTIPQGTKLQSVTIRRNGIHINLSQEFTSGGGSESMIARLGQVIYTATSFQPNAKVWVSVAGKPLDVLGGEGLLVDQPSTRRNFEENFGLAAKTQVSSPSRLSAKLKNTKVMGKMLN